MEHIHANEVILVFGYSRTVLHFLRRAAEKRSFEVGGGPAGRAGLDCASPRRQRGGNETTSSSLPDCHLLPALQVVVTEGAPTYQGQQMARELAALGIHATLVADAAVFAMMARVNKVCGVVQCVYGWVCIGLEGADTAVPAMMARINKVCSGVWQRSGPLRAPC